MIVIPMAGKSSRFFSAGYEKPKYMLDAHGMTLFEHSLKSFERYFKTEKFLIVIRDIQGTKLFVESKLASLGVIEYEVIVLNSPTRGQAETVYLALEQEQEQKSDQLTIFNIDTFRLGFKYPSLVGDCDGYLEVFEGDGKNWSFARTDSEGTVIETAEKRPISNLCSTGLYYFSNVEDFLYAYKKVEALPEGELQGGELYVAPLYNLLIQQGKKIKVNVIGRDEVVFCGVPGEYEAFKLS